MANILSKTLLGILIPGGVVVASVRLYSNVRESGKEAERSEITQDLRNHQYGLLRDAEFVYRATPIQDSLLRDAHSVEYVINRLKKVKK